MFRSLLVLSAGSVALLFVILLHRDVRWRQRAIDHAKWHVATLAQRAGDSAILPLNLEPGPGEAQASRAVQIEYLSREEVLRLRDAAGPILVAQTVPVFRVFAPDGRAIILFDQGRFEVKWVTLSEFARLQAAQQEKVQRLMARGKRQPPGR